ncbi:AAA family ATPase [Enterococcus faecalis]|uniref:AAA family ATPase n=1 Tax=Enterococcus faecalis TaxID=1351 RepID=UPI003F7E52F6
MNYYFNDFFPNKDGLHFYQDNWNDFGYSTLFNCKLIKEGKNIKLGSVSFATIKEANEAYVNRGNSSSSYNWVNYSAKSYLENEYVGQLNDNIISLGTTEYYKNLYEYFSPNVVDEILINLNDIAYNTQLYDKNKDSDVIQTSFLRGSNEFTLKNQLSRIAKNGKERITYSFSLEYSFEQIKQFSINFAVDPDSNLPSNVFALIGNNGTGKTTIIQDLVKSYIKKDKLNTNLVDNTQVELSFSDEEQNIPLESILFISFSPFDILNSNYFTGSEHGTSFKYVGNSEFENDKQLIKSPLKLAEDLVSNIIKIKHSPERIKMWNRYSQKLVFDYQIGDFLNLLNQTADIKTIEFLNIVSKLSSGQKMILLGLSALVAQVTEKTLVIIDEPESYLHPPLVSAYVRILSDILKENNGVAILATHSPIIIQEIPKDCVWVIERSPEITVRHPLTETFGENIGVIMDDIFKLDIRNTGFYSYLSQLAETDSPRIKILEEENNLGSEASMFLYALTEESE